jgi:hypothetical protein
MTWFSEYSASPRRRLASSAIRCPSVDRFAGFSVPSRVSGQRSSLRDASLPSTGSRRARFPDFTGTMKALRLPVRAYPVPYGFGSRLHALLRVRFAMALPKRRRSAVGPGEFGQPVSPLRRPARGHARDLSGSLAFHPIPLPGSKTPAGPAGLALCGPVDAAPGNVTPKAPAEIMISRLTPGFSICCLRFTSGVAIAHAKLASGWRAATFTGRELNPLERIERFQFIFPPFQGLS